MIKMRNEYNDVVFISEMIDGTVKVYTEQSETVWNLPISQIMQIYQYNYYEVID